MFPFLHDWLIRIYVFPLLSNKLITVTTVGAFLPISPILKKKSIDHEEFQRIRKESRKTLSLVIRLISCCFMNVFLLYSPIEFLLTAYESESATNWNETGVRRRGMWSMYRHGITLRSAFQTNSVYLYNTLASIANPVLY